MLRHLVGKLERHVVDYQVIDIPNYQIDIYENELLLASDIYSYLVIRHTNNLVVSHTSFKFAN